jgi:NAD(P)-dependent dehydrogenase (short-subunit alcohol dehydrogenase family)
VPGGARGIGRAVAAALAADGWRVAVAARRDSDDVRSLRDSLGDGHDVALCDVSDAAAARRWVDAVGERLGPVDALVHAAGPFARAAQSTDDAAAWRSVFSDNLFAVVGLAGAVVPAMRERAWGRVVVFGHAGVATLRPPPTIAAWYAAKAALVCFSRALAAECAGRGVTVNCVSPGVIDTGGMDAETFERLAAQVPGGVAGRSEDVAALVRWLLTDEAAHVTGAEITVAGGWDLPRSAYKSG